MTHEADGPQEWRKTCVALITSKQAYTAGCKLVFLIINYVQTERGSAARELDLLDISLYGIYQLGYIYTFISWDIYMKTQFHLYIGKVSRFECYGIITSEPSE